jgi:hypothetical protein
MFRFKKCLEFENIKIFKNVQILISFGSKNIHSLKTPIFTKYLDKRKEKKGKKIPDRSWHR